MRSIGKDVAAGGVFVATGVFFAVYAWSTLPLGNAFRMGPGFFPVVVSGLLAAFGGAVMLSGLRAKAEARRPVNWRAVVLVTLALVGFGVMVRPLGMAPALLLAAFCAAFASRGVSIARAAAISAGLIAGCIVLFGYLLDLSIPMLGDWFR